MGGKPETGATEETEKKGWLKGRFESVVSKTQEHLTVKAEEYRQGLSQGRSVSGDLLNKVTSFASSAAEIAKNIDDDLRARGSAYEIGHFRVMGNLSVVGGLTLDIHFTKTAYAKEDGMFLVVINPRTERPLKIPRNAIVGREQAKIRDPETGEVLLIDTRSGNILVE